jgi:TPR repeat protein
VLGRIAERGLGQDKNLREAPDFYRDAAILGAPDGYMESGRLHLESGSHDSQKQAYFWYGIAARYRFPGAAEKLKEVTALLSESEVAKESKQVAEWLKLPSGKRTAELKQH